MYLEPPKVLEEAVTLLKTAPIAGVFFLCKGDSIEYIGFSTDVLMRVKGMSDVVWDRAYYRPYPAEDMPRYAMSLICKYQPRFNPQCRQRKTDNDRD